MKFYNFFDFILKDLKKSILIIFLSTFILRIPTLFVEYYSGDVLSSFLTSLRELNGLDYVYNKGILYHKILNFSLLVFGKDIRSFHFVGIIIVFLTSFFIFLLGKRIYNQRIGLLAGFFYGVYISAFNPEFMAINGEIVYNLFYASSFYYFYLFYFERKKLMIIPTILSLICSFAVKFQGFWASVAILFFIVYISPYFYFLDLKIRKKYYLITISLTVLVFLFLVIDYSYTNLIIKGRIKDSIDNLVIYSTVRGFNFLFFPKLIYRVSLMSVYHWAVWVLGLYYIVSYFKNKNKNLKDIYLITLTIILFFLIFTAGTRIYFHYFMHVYPVLSILGARAFMNLFENNIKFRKRSFIYFVIPIIFVFVWNLRDAYIVKFNNDLFYNETRFVYYLRLILLGHYDDYLLCNKMMKEAVDYIKNNVKDDEKIYAWPNADEIIFFSRKRSAKKVFSGEEIPANFALNQRLKGNIKESEKYEIGIAKEVIDNSDYFVDISSVKTKSNIAKYGGIYSFPLLLSLIEKNFDFVGNFGEVRIWKKKGK
ncbi:MAG TPA: glycosyltransferase family 39 protein [Spirochaetota bacterium]|nr:glycosyltransferase family 39 protein [Spirochaetota bacterium]HOM38654.1 glycosyltransferase family 39 protein [Spirochaetota bacterium]HPQ49830.1 glycosyltransferase family 39 protein [Spirochaetota bacterium]